jgi:hypothetical protein
MVPTKFQPAADPPDPERRVEGLAGRRRTSGRRADDRLASQFAAIIPCTACHVAWASLSSVAHEGGRATAVYLCPRCQHQETVAGQADTA